MQKTLIITPNGIKITGSWVYPGGKVPGSEKSIADKPLNTGKKTELVSNAPWIKEKNFMEKMGIPNTC